MDLVKKYLDEGVKTLPQKKGKKKKGLPTLKYLKTIFGDEVIKDLKKGIDYE